MPALDLKGKLKREDVIAAYEKDGWRKIIEFPWIELNGRTGQIFMKQYRFDSNALQCSRRSCSRYGLTFVRLAPHGVIWICAMCRRTMGPMAWEDGELLNGPLGEQITLVQAWDMLAKTGQTVPVGLPPLSGSEGLQIV